MATIERAAELLGVPAADIAAGAAKLKPWGEHASGEPVYPCASYNGA